MFRFSNAIFSHFGSFAPKTCLPTYFLLNFCDFLVPVLSGANDPKWRFLFVLHFFSSENSLWKKFLSFLLVFGTYTKVSCLCDDLVLRNHWSKLTKSQGGCTRIALVHWSNERACKPDLPKVTSGVRNCGKFPESGEILGKYQKIMIFSGVTKENWLIFPYIIDFFS